MQIFDCRTSPVRLQSFVPCFPLGSFPIAIAAINLSRAWATKWVNTVHTPNVSRSQSQANCDSRMAFPYVSASCCGNFLHILATTFSTSLEFLLVLFLPSSFYFSYFSSCVNKSQKRRRRGVCWCLCWPAPKVENSLGGMG